MFKTSTTHETSTPAETTRGATGAPRTRTRSRMGVMAALAAAVATAGLLAACGGAATTAAPPPAAAVAQRKAVTVDGAVQPAQQARLAFQIGGRIVNVAPAGQPVRAGDVIAQLDTRDLEAAVRAAQDDLVLARAQEAQARELSLPQQVEAATAAVRASRSRLAEVQSGPREAERRVAEAAVEQAVARLKDAASKRDQVDAPARPADVEAARSTLEKAARDAEAAHARLAQVEGGATASELAAARSGVERATADLASARATLKQVLDGPSAADVAAARAQLDQARTRLAQLQDAPRVAPQDVANARLSVELAQAALDKAHADATDYNLVGIGKPLSRQAADNAVKQAELQLRTAQNAYDKIRGSGPSDWDLRLAEESLASAQAAYDRTVKPATPEDRGRAEAQVVASGAALTAAQAALEKTMRGADETELVTARGASASAEAGVAAARARLEQVVAGATTEERSAAAASVEAATADLRGAQAKLDQVLAGATQADVDQALGSLASAQATEAQTRRGPSEPSIQAAAARTKRAETTLEQAHLALEHAALRAPFDGVITSVAVKPGEYVAPGAAGLTVADLTVLKIETKDLDEAAAARVREGQEVAVTVAALDRKVLNGVVTEISHQPTLNQSGDVFYTATIALPQREPALRWGMTVRVEFKD